MGLKWNCDICGKPTFMNPPVEPVTEEKEVEVDVPAFKEVEVEDTIIDPKTGNEKKVKRMQGKFVTEKVKKKVLVQKKVKQRKQNPETGKIEIIDYPEYKDLEPRCYIIKLRVGMEHVQRDVCKECMETIPHLKELWKHLEGMESK